MFWRPVYRSPPASTSSCGRGSAQYASHLQTHTHTHTHTHPHTHTNTQTHTHTHTHTRGLVRALAVFVHCQQEPCLGIIVSREGERKKLSILISIWIGIDRSTRLLS